MAREYKDSGIEWIGQIPKEWNTIPFKAFFVTGKGLSFTKADLTPWGKEVISYGQVHSKINTGTRLDDSLIRHIPDTITTNGESSKMSKGDFIFADTSEDLEGCGNCVYIDKDTELYAGYHSVTAKPKVQHENKYIAYYFLTPCWRSQIRSRVTGIKVYSISQSIINKTYLLVPPFSEQQKIADYLDKVCGEVDEMIALQEKMIEELKAYKQSVITEAVTKGLNPNVPMKDSGIDWIGEIPEHWTVCRIKDLVHTQSGRNLTTNEIMPNGVYPVYGGNGIRGYYSDYSNDGNYILIGRQGALCGNINYAQGKFWATEHAVVCYPKYDFEIIWLGELLRSMNLGQYSLSAAQPGLAVERIRNIEMPLPPRLEQHQIASYLDTKCSDIDSLITVKQQKIEELKEYKKSVIYEYVTGKKEVV